MLLYKKIVAHDFRYDPRIGSHVLSGQIFSLFYGTGTFIIDLHALFSFFGIYVFPNFKMFSFMCGKY